MTTQRLSWTTLAQLAPAIREELFERVRDGRLTIADSLRQVFVARFGAHRSAEERTLYLLFAAPLARRIAIELAKAGERSGATDVSVSDLNAWLWWLGRMDPVCARMIDLHYFAGLSFKETAAALDLPLHTVIRALRFAKAWLKVRLD